MSSDRGEIELNEYEQIRQEISALVMEDYREAQVKAGKKWRAVFCRGDSRNELCLYKRSLCLLFY